MVWRAAVGRRWERWSDAVKRELLREPDRVLLDLGPEALASQQEKAPAAERTHELR